MIVVYHYEVNTVSRRSALKDENIMDGFEELATRLSEARKTGNLIPNRYLGIISNTSQATTVLSSQCRKRSQDIAGWKIGAASGAALSALNLDEPFIGPLFSEDIYDYRKPSPLVMRHQPMLEVELTIVLAKPLLRGLKTDEEALEAVASINTSFEIVGSRILGEPIHPGYRSIADGGGNMGAVIGPELPDWSANYEKTLAIQVEKNGKTVAKGTTDMLLWSNIAHALRWASSAAFPDNQSLAKNDILMTGTCTPLIPLCSGDSIRARFGDLVQFDAQFV
jgi:2-keto-4-pentenoate hydratase